MAEARRIVVDTNVFVSAIGLPRSIPRQEVDKVLDEGVLLISESTLHELAEVLARKNLARYVSVDLRSMFLSQLMNSASSCILRSSCGSAAILKRQVSGAGAEWK